MPFLAQASGPLHQISFPFQQCHRALGHTLPGVSEGRCGYHSGNSHLVVLVVALRGCRDLHRLVGLGKESHPDNGEGPDTHHTIKVRPCHEAGGGLREP